MAAEIPNRGEWVSLFQISSRLNSQLPFDRLKDERMRARRPRSQGDAYQPRIGVRDMLGTGLLPYLGTRKSSTGRPD